MDVETELLELIQSHGLAPKRGGIPVAEPLTDWLDSMARLELVELIESRWSVDVEPILMGEDARKMTFLQMCAQVAELAK